MAIYPIYPIDHSWNEKKAPAKLNQNGFDAYSPQTDHSSHKKGQSN